MSLSDPNRLQALHAGQSAGPGPVPRAGVLDIAPYVPGEAGVPGFDRPIRLASNEGALGPSPEAVTAYEALSGDLHRYPDGSGRALRTAIAARFGLDAERIVCGNGSDDLLHLLAQAYCGPEDEVLHTAHGFLVYPIAARAAGAVPVSAPEADLHADVDALLARVTERTRIVFLANPNNPTGTYLPASEIARLQAGLPGRVLLVLDAAYAEYVKRSDYEPGVRLVESCENVVMTRTFSKIFALGGLRLGWAYAPPAVVDVLNRMRGPFNTNVAAQAAGVAALGDEAFLLASLDHNERWRPWLTEQLQSLGLSLTPSVANFVLAGFGTPDRAEAARVYLKKNGVVVRQMGGYGLPHCLRISIGLDEEMRAVVDYLTAFRELTGAETAA